MYKLVPSRFGIELYILPKNVIQNYLHQALKYYGTRRCIILPKKMSEITTMQKKLCDNNPAIIWFCQWLPCEAKLWQSILCNIMVTRNLILLLSCVQFLKRHKYSNPLVGTLPTGIKKTIFLHTKLPMILQEYLLQVKRSC